MKFRVSPVFISIGANLSTKDGRVALASCRLAAESLRAIPGMRLHALSKWYETDPIPPGGPSYINGVAWLEGEADPAWLLSRLQAIESRGGRTRSTPNAPRTLDLDIIAMGDLMRDLPDPMLPHPRAYIRRFVMEPLAEIAPFWVHPGTHQTVRALLAELPPQRVKRLHARPV